ncbi:MAG: response regulator [Bradymonadaceae bacterium]|nr:response regulator [Lujinxingiaceae bacterium]
MALRVLIIDDSELILQMLAMVCQGAGYTVEILAQFPLVAACLERASFDVVITDLNLPDVPGNDTVAALRTYPQLATTPIVIISGQPRATLNTIASERGAQGALSKDDGLPAIASELPAMIARLAAGD